MRQPLIDCLRFLRAQQHVLQHQPWRCFQQASTLPDTSGPGRMAAARAHAGREHRPWLRWVNKPSEWDPALVTLHGGGRRAGFAFSPDSRHVVVGWSDASMRVFDAETGRSLVRLPKPKRPDDYPWDDYRDLTVMGCAFVAEGTRIATFFEDGTIKLWDAATGAEVVTLAAHGKRYACAWGVAPDGSRIAAAFQDGSLKIWNMMEDRPPIEFKIEAGLAPLCLALTRESEEGLALLAVAFSHGKIEQFTAANGCVFLPIETALSCDPVQYSSDGRRLLGRYRWDIPGPPTPPAVWDLVGNKLAEFKGHTEVVTACSFSPRGDRVVTSSDDKSVRVWTAEGEELVQFRGHGRAVSDCCFSPDGRLVASASRDRTVKVWESDTGRELATLTGHPDPVNACTFSPDGSKIISMSNRMTRIWDAAARTTAEAVGAEPIEWVEDLPDHVQLGPYTVGVTGAGSLVVIDSESGEDRCEFEVKDRLVAVALGGDGRIVARDDWGKQYVLVPENLL